MSSSASGPHAPGAMRGQEGGGGGGQSWSVRQHEGAAGNLGGTKGDGKKEYSRADALCSKSDGRIRTRVDKPRGAVDVPWAKSDWRMDTRADKSGAPS